MDLEHHQESKTLKRPGYWWTIPFWRNVRIRSKELKSWKGSINLNCFNKPIHREKRKNGNAGCLLICSMMNGGSVLGKPPYFFAIKIILKYLSHWVLKKTNKKKKEMKPRFLHIPRVSIDISCIFTTREAKLSLF